MAKLRHLTYVFVGNCLVYVHMYSTRSPPQNQIWGDSNMPSMGSTSRSANIEARLEKSQDPKGEMTEVRNKTLGHLEMQPTKNRGD